MIGPGMRSFILVGIWILGTALGTILGTACNVVSIVVTSLVVTGCGMLMFNKALLENLVVTGMQEKILG